MTKDVVSVYDKIAGWFDASRSRTLMERRYLDFLVSRVPAGASVLDLGCGAGEPIMRFLLKENFHVLGVDASAAMLALAKSRFPTARFLQADMRHLDLNEKFDAIIAWHSFFHLPHDDQRRMFPVLGAHTAPGGLLMFTSGPRHGEDWGENGGEQLYHASLDAEEYRALLGANGFAVLEHVVEDPDCGGATVWVAGHA